MSSEGAFTSYCANNAYICSTTWVLRTMLFSWDFRVSSCSTYLCGMCREGWHWRSGSAMVRARLGRPYLVSCVLAVRTCTGGWRLGRASSSATVSLVWSYVFTYTLAAGLGRIHSTGKRQATNGSALSASCSCLFKETRCFDRALC